MEKNNKIELIAEVLDIEPEAINEDMNLKEMDEWDSLAILSFIVMMGDEFNKTVTGEDVKKLITVADALAIME